MAGICYSVKKNRIRQGFHPGFELLEDGTLSAQTQEAEHYLYLRSFDGTEQDADWGRLRFQAEFGEDMTCYVYVAAMNEDSFYRQGAPTKIEDFLCSLEESSLLKRHFLEQIHAKRYVNQKDILLYDQKGRYLYIVFELIGEGAASFSNIKVEKQGDNFMNTFPEIYRENGGFFHRFLSVFSSIYNDFQTDIDGVAALLELDECPEELLPVYARWLGIEVSDEFATEEWLRTLVKEAYHLNRMKGTKWAIERVAEIVLGEPVLVLENNVMKEYVKENGMEQFRKLYGSSDYDVTVLVKRYTPELLKSRLLLLLEQFKPIRSRIHIIYLKDSTTLDYHSYMDMNAVTAKEEKGCLDEDRQFMDGVTTLQ